MNAVRALDGLPLPQVVRRPGIPRQAPPESFADVVAYLDRKLENVEADLADDETMKSLGVHGTARMQERRAVLLDLQWYIGPAAAAEAAEQVAVAAQDAEDARWRDDPSLGAGGWVEAFRG